jgi:hypothetical protein
MKENTAAVYVGIDIAKATLQVHRQGTQAERANSPATHRKLCKELQSFPAAPFGALQEDQTPSS